MHLFTKHQVTHIHISHSLNAQAKKKKATAPKKSVYKKRARVDISRHGQQDRRSRSTSRHGHPIDYQYLVDLQDVVDTPEKNMKEAPKKEKTKPKKKTGKKPIKIGDRVKVKFIKDRTWKIEFIEEDGSRATLRDGNEVIYAKMKTIFI